MAHKKLLSIKDLNISAFKSRQEHKIISNISYDLLENEIVAVVGESGSGKSVSSLALMGLLPKQILKITSGSITFENKELVQLSDKNFQKIRGNQISMIFQEPMSSLNPSMRCGNQVEEILKQHTELSASEIKEEILELFEKVKLIDQRKIIEANISKFQTGRIKGKSTADRDTRSKITI